MRRAAWLGIDHIYPGQITKLHKKHDSVYWAGKMHAKLQREVWVIGRDLTARLMKLAGVRGVRRSKKVYTTKSNSKYPPPGDKVERRFSSSGPTELLVCDQHKNIRNKWFYVRAFDFHQRSVPEGFLAHYSVTSIRAQTDTLASKIVEMTPSFVPPSQW